MVAMGKFGCMYRRIDWFYAYHQRSGIRQMSSRQIDGVWLLSFPIRSKQAATTQDDPKIHM